MLSVAVTAVIILTGSAQAGYFYPRPNIVFELPKNEPNFQEGLTQKTRQENAALQTHETVVSYSVPFEDFYYLRQNKIGQQVRPNFAANTRTVHNVGVPSVSVSTVKQLSTSAPLEHIVTGNKPVDHLRTDVPVAIQPLISPAPINYQSNLAVNSLQHINNPAASIPNVKLSTLLKQQSNLPVNTVQHVINIPTVNVPTVNVPAPINQQNNLAVNTVPHINIPIDNRPIVNLPIQLSEQTNSQLNSVHHLNIPVVSTADINVPVLNNQETNLRFPTQQVITNQVINDDLEGSITAQNVVVPKITKDIYFHVPPPEFEEPPVHTVIPKKKVYKIIFIKVPSQETKSIAQLQQLANTVAPIEDKTIIYVLSKKPEPQQVFLPKPVPSEHEVLFVKYSGNPDATAALANDNLGQSDSELLVGPNLQPGIINGKR
ncbi:uncharacterized protein [Epargyreus clarus]|uniref:uncharacterized protein n=1 Tax=Epargyreus clarus TaxID=520877 RepID=UPI003C2C72E3